MPYHLSAFCTDGDVPSRAEILAWAQGREPWLGFVPPGEKLLPEHLEDRPGRAEGVFYNQDDVFVVDIYRAGERSEVLEKDICAGVVDGFRRRLEQLSPSPQRDHVLEHLARTRFLVSVAMPVSQFGDDERAWGAVDLLLDYFVERHGGLVHGEGEGFYDSDGRLLVTIR
jgi:hypothetical protein